EPGGPLLVTVVARGAVLGSEDENGGGEIAGEIAEAAPQRVRPLPRRGVGGELLAGAPPQLEVVDDDEAAVGARARHGPAALRLQLREGEAAGAGHDGEAVEHGLRLHRRLVE